MTHHALRAILLTVALSFALPACAQQMAKRDQFGINLSGVSYYSSSMPLANLMTQARPWRGIDADGNDVKIEYDEYEYPILKPGQSAKTVVLNRFAPAGEYVFTYEGDFKLKYEMEGLETISENPGRIVFRGKPEGYLQLVISDINPENPPRQFRLWLPGQVNGTFNPVFLEHTRPYFSTHRYMDWMQTNRSPIKTWADRPHLEDFSYGVKGMPLERLIEFANLNDANPWFCMPHAADDDYIRKFAAMVKARLHPGLTVYVEYSNEVGNPTFSGYKYCVEKGKALGLISDAELETMEDWRQTYVYRHRYQAHRTIEIAKIWKAVFADNPKQVISVITEKPSRLEIGLAYPGAAEWIDAIAGCSYWGFNVQAKLAKPFDNLTTDTVFEKLEEDLDTKILEKAQGTAALGRKYNKPVLLYEGGQHLSAYGGRYDELSDSDKQKLEEVSLKCQRDDRMGELMKKDFDIWFGEGNAELYCIFSHVTPASGRYAWGLWEYLGQPMDEAPKAKATIEYLRGE